MKLRQRLLSQLVSGTALALAAGGMVLAEADPLIGTMRIVGENFCPRGWSQMNGQILAISQNQALFSLLGCTYGGDCRTSFALPDMRGRTPIGISDNHPLGQRGGAEDTTLSEVNLASHTHALNASDRMGTRSSPANADIAELSAGAAYSTSAPTPTQQFNAATMTSSGGSLPFSIRQPYQVINYCIATTGIFPSRN